jgi:hypothetical protein
MLAKHALSQLSYGPYPAIFSSDQTQPYGPKARASKLAAASGAPAERPARSADQPRELEFGGPEKI